MEHVQEIPKSIAEIRAQIEDLKAKINDVSTKVLEYKSIYTQNVTHLSYQDSFAAAKNILQWQAEMDAASLKNEQMLKYIDEKIEEAAKAQKK